MSTRAVFSFQANFRNICCDCRRNTFNFCPVGLIWKAMGFLHVRLNLACVMLNNFFSLRTDHGRPIISFSQGTAKYGDVVWRASG